MLHKKVFLVCVYTYAQKKCGYIKVPRKNVGIAMCVYRKHHKKCVCKCVYVSKKIAYVNASGNSTVHMMHLRF